MYSPVAEATACRNQHVWRISFPRIMHGKSQAKVRSGNQRYGVSLVRLQALKPKDISDLTVVAALTIVVQWRGEVKCCSFPQISIEIDDATMLLYYQSGDGQAQAIATYF